MYIRIDVHEKAHMHSEWMEPCVCIFYVRLATQLPVFILVYVSSAICYRTFEANIIPRQYGCHCSMQTILSTYKWLLLSTWGIHI